MIRSMKMTHLTSMMSWSALWIHFPFVRLSFTKLKPPRFMKFLVYLTLSSADYPFTRNSMSYRELKFPGVFLVPHFRTTAAWSSFV